MRRFLPLALVLAMLGFVVVRLVLSRQPAPPLAVGLWYWHSPFRLSAVEARGLRELGVRTVFVRAGTISASGHGVELTLPQVWQRSPGVPAVHLVFAMDSGVVRHFEDIPEDGIARCIAAAYVRQQLLAERVGLRVLGVQIDFDCATRLLPKYSRLLSKVRHALPRGTILSITSLPTWFTSPDMRELVEQVDFYCPQFYETEIGRLLADAKPASDLRRLKNGLQAAGRLGKPFHAGIPAYGHAFMFDDTGRLLGSYRGMSASEAARHPSFRLARSWPSDESGRRAVGRKQWVGEDFVDFVAVRPGAGGRGLGYHLVYSIPAARMVSVNLRAVRECRPRNCLGVAVFRFAEQGEAMTLPMESLSAALRGRESRPRIRARADVESTPWEAVEGGRAERSSVVTVSLTNTGNAASFPSVDSVVLALRFDVPGVEVARGDFDAIRYMSSSGMLASPARASRLMCRKFRLDVGETIRLGPIHVYGARTMRGEWRVNRPGGFGVVEGKMDPVRIQEEVGRR